MTTTTMAQIADHPHRPKVVEDYIETLRGWKALQRAVKDDGPTPARLAALQDALVAMRHARVILRGAQIQQAERVVALAERRTP